MILQRGNAAVRVEFEDGTVYAFNGPANLRMSSITTEFQDSAGKKIGTKQERRSEVVVVEERE